MGGNSAKKRQLDESSSSKGTKDDKKAKKQQKVECVILKTDGSRESGEIDAFDDQDILAEKILGGKIMTLATWEDFDYIILGRKDQSNEDLEPNQSDIPPPFSDCNYRGNLIVTKVNEKGVRENVDMEEYEEFEMTGDDDIAVVTQTSIAMAEEDLARELTDDEIAFVKDCVTQLSNISDEVKSKLLEDVMSNTDKVQDDDDNCDEDEKCFEIDSEKFLIDVKSRFESWTNSASKTSSLNLDLLTNLSNFCLDAYLAFEDDNDENEDADDNITSKEAFLDHLVENLIGKFIERENREPNEDEVQEIIQQAEKLVAETPFDDNDEDDGEDDDVEDDGGDGNNNDDDDDDDDDDEVDDYEA